MQSVWGIGRKVSSRHELVLSMFPPYKTIQQGHGAQLIICSCFDTKGTHVPLNKLWEGKQKQVMVCFSLGVPFQNSFFFFPYCNRSLTLHTSCPTEQTEIKTYIDVAHHQLCQKFSFLMLYCNLPERWTRHTFLKQSMVKHDAVYMHMYVNLHYGSIAK